MEDFITKVIIIKDSLAATSEALKESEVILITLGALGEEFESFVTSITTRYAPSMTFTTLCELLMDQEMRIEKSKSTAPLFVNVVVKTYNKKNEVTNSTKLEL